MENQQGAEGSDVEQKEHEAGGKDVEEVFFILQDFYFKMNDAYFIQWICSWFKGAEITINAILCATICHL